MSTKSNPEQLAIHMTHADWDALFAPIDAEINATGEAIAARFAANVPSCVEHSNDDNLEECGACDELSPFSPRNAIVLHSCLTVMADELDMETADLGDAPIAPGEQPYRFGELPVASWRLGRAWRERYAKAAWSLVADIERGLVPDPRCPAEEAILRLAVCDAASELAADWRALACYGAAPASPCDDDWDMVLDRLMQDLDIEFALWPGELDGIEHPDDEINQQMGIGDYRPAAWFEPFLNRQPRAA